MTFQLGKGQLRVFFFGQAIASWMGILLIIEGWSIATKGSVLADSVYLVLIGLFAVSATFFVVAAARVSQLHRSALSVLRVWGFVLGLVILAEFGIRWMQGVSLMVQVGATRPWLNPVFSGLLWGGFGLYVLFAGILVLSQHTDGSDLPARTPRLRLLVSWVVRASLIRRLFRGTSYLTGVQVLKLRMGFKSCRSCAYLVSTIYRPEPAARFLEIVDKEHVEVGARLRATSPGEWDVGSAHCYRNIWNNRTLDAEPEELERTQISAALKPRWCGQYYSYSEGVPEEHRDSHRSRTNRRWLVAGGLLGPYIATSLGFIASDYSTSGSLSTDLAQGLGYGFAGLAVLAFLINIIFNRTG